MIVNIIIKFSAIASMVVAITACGSQPEFNIQTVPEKVMSQQCHITQSESFIWLEQESEWDELPEQARSQLGIQPINWATENTLIISEGNKPNAGYGLELTNWLLEENHWQVTRVQHKPAKGTMQAQMIVSPCIMVKIPKRVKSFTLLNEAGRSLGRWPY